MPLPATVRTTTTTAAPTAANGKDPIQSTAQVETTTAFSWAANLRQASAPAPATSEAFPSTGSTAEEEAQHIEASTP